MSLPHGAVGLSVIVAFPVHTHLLFSEIFIFFTPAQPLVFSFWRTNKLCNSNVIINITSCVIMCDVIVQKKCYASNWYTIKIMIQIFGMIMTFISLSEAKKCIFHE